MSPRQLAANPMLVTMGLRLAPLPLVLTRALQELLLVLAAECDHAEGRGLLAARGLDRVAALLAAASATIDRCGRAVGEPEAFLVQVTPAQAGALLAAVDRAGDTPSLLSELCAALREGAR